MNYTRMKERATEQGVSFRFMSSKLGKGAEYLSHCERDGTEISPENQKKIASMLSTTVAYLNDETDNPEIDDTEILDYINELRNDPDKRMLFKSLDGCTKADIQRAVAIIEALKKNG